jgi:hypothetical protein
MSEDEKREETEDVEAHRHGKGNAAHDEAKTEGESDDDFEAHRHGKLNFRPSTKG